MPYFPCSYECTSETNLLRINMIFEKNITCSNLLRFIMFFVKFRLNISFNNHPFIVHYFTISVLIFVKLNHDGSMLHAVKSVYWIISNPIATNRSLWWLIDFPGKAVFLSACFVFPPLGGFRPLCALYLIKSELNSMALQVLYHVQRGTRPVS